MNEGSDRWQVTIFTRVYPTQIQPDEVAEHQLVFTGTRSECVAIALGYVEHMVHPERVYHYSFIIRDVTQNEKRTLNVVQFDDRN